MILIFIFILMIKFSITFESLINNDIIYGLKLTSDYYKNKNTAM